MQYLRKSNPLPPYMAYPRFLLLLDINETARLVYILLLDRARLSMKNDGWEDEGGYVYIYYTIQALAKDSSKCEMTIKTSLASLEKHGLIYRKHQGAGKPNKIYVRIPTESFPSVGIYTETRRDRILSGNNNQRNNKRKTIRDYDYEDGESL